jgi:methylglutaconyl-CoA hydratase
MIRYDVTGGVATVTLDSPRNRNALSNRLTEELTGALTSAMKSDAVRVIVLTGSGPVFCSGLDLTEVGERSPDVAGVLRTIWDGPKPVVARVNGPARAGGVGLVSACDIAVAPESATFAFTEVRIGAVPAMIAVTCLRRMDQRAAAELFLTGEVFDGRRAQEVGLINRAVPAEELDATVEKFIDMLMRGAPEALTIAKRLPRVIPGMPVGEGFARATEMSAQKFASDEATEGIAAFREKRDPSWYPGRTSNE